MIKNEYLNNLNFDMYEQIQSEAIWYEGKHTLIKDTRVQVASTPEGRPIYVEYEIHHYVYDKEVDQDYRKLNYYQLEGILSSRHHNYLYRADYSETYKKYPLATSGKFGIDPRFDVIEKYNLNSKPPVTITDTKLGDALYVAVCRVHMDSTPEAHQVNCSIVSEDFKKEESALKYIEKYIEGRVEFYKAKYDKTPPVDHSILPSDVIHIGKLIEPNCDVEKVFKKMLKQFLMTKKVRDLTEYAKTP